MRVKDIYQERRELSEEYNDFMRIRIGINESIEQILRKNPLTLTNEDKNRLVDLIVKRKDVEDKLKKIREMFEGIRKF